ncbi:helix-turn-helix domain-containing protein [Mangrovihabitans endophyticus]|uniref:Transcriptional regulator n=1 Tax=Mangrovihabitans endophyticus TaxID=1751298 RepID=A0A8J3C4Z2_9ACTN|nr:XRE family transcriptional regulator [Mangrovihabitans endophyticus]GGL11244.1 transcriptional regulator [Mangrovihabitans endophyticus]
MTQGAVAQGDGLEDVVRARIRALRVARSWSLDDLAQRCFVSPSSLSRIETGHRRLSLDQLTAIARALDTSLDELLASPDAADDVVIRPRHDPVRGRTMWTLDHEPGPDGMTVARLRVTRPVSRGADALRVHPGKDWFTVLSGTIELVLGERHILIETGQAATFSTMIPHAFGAHGGPAEVLAILDHSGQRTHLHMTPELDQI